jgi:hypothetical protein
MPQMPDVLEGKGYQLSGYACRIGTESDRNDIVMRGIT